MPDHAINVTCSPATPYNWHIKRLLQVSLKGLIQYVFISAVLISTLYLCDFEVEAVNRMAVYFVYDETMNS